MVLNDVRISIKGLGQGTALGPRRKELALNTSLDQGESHICREERQRARKAEMDIAIGLKRKTQALNDREWHRLVS